MHLTIIDPSAVPGNWEWMRGHLEKAIKHDPSRDEQYIYEELCRGGYRAFGISGEANGVVVTSDDTPALRICYLGGTITPPIRERVNLLMSAFEDVGRYLDCNSIVMTGRKGWARFLVPLGYERLEDDGPSAQFRKGI